MYRNEPSSRLTFKIPVTGDFADSLKVFRDISYPPSGVAGEQIAFVIMELLSNSIRAQRELGRNDPVTAELASVEKTMQITISDSGGGFDLSLLPYKLDQKVETIDVMSDSFDEYRQRYNNARFGMGLVATRKVFPQFKLAFVDENSREVAWPSSAIMGTVITLGIPMVAEGGSP